MVKIDERLKEQFNRRAAAGWKSTTLSSYRPQSSTTQGVRPGGGILGYASILDPPRNRPFIRPYDLANINSQLRYFRYAQQLQKYDDSQAPQESDKYDQILRNAKHYEVYLARLMLNLRRQRGISYSQGLRYARMAQSLFRQGKSINFVNFALQAFLRKETGELVYNPLFQSYNERKTWFGRYPHPWNYTDPTFREERIFRDKREDRARRDFYIIQGRRLDWLPRLWPDSSSGQTSIRGGRWILIKVVRITKTKIRKTFLHTKTKERIQRYYLEPLPRRHFAGNRRHRDRNYRDYSRRYRRRY